MVEVVEVVEVVEEEVEVEVGAEPLAGRGRLVPGTPPGEAGIGLVERPGGSGGCAPAPSPQALSPAASPLTSSSPTTQRPSSASQRSCQADITPSWRVVGVAGGPGRSGTSRPRRSAGAQERWWCVATARFPGYRLGAMAGDASRVDSWLWAVRIYKTRSLATEACRAGHVSIGGRTVKPSHPLVPGDLVEVRVDGWDRLLEVVVPIGKRVGPAVAAGCLVDRSPPRPERDPAGQPGPLRAAPGRPTKRDRRALERLRGREG